MRKKIPVNTEFEIFSKSGRKCCVCKNRGDHIHHIDGNPANNDTDNLVLLCFDDHNDASVRGSLRRGLSKGMLIRYRERHYKDVAAERVAAIKVVSNNSSKLTGEDLLQAAKDAIILLDLETIKADYDRAEWEGKVEQIEKLRKFYMHASDRSVYEILAFLEDASSQTRMNMPAGLSNSIVWMAINYFPRGSGKANKRHDNETGALCLAIGFNSAYDCAIKLRKLSYIPLGLTLWKHVYKHAKKTRNKKLIQDVVDNYNSLEETLKRPERNDLQDAIELVRIFRADLENPDLAYPIYTDHLMNAIQTEEKADRQGRK